MKDDQQVNSLSMGKRDFAKVEGAMGTLYKKQIIKFGNYVDPWFPEWPMTLDSEWGDMIKDNFDKKVVGRVAVPASHTDDPEKNRGELLAVENDGEGLNGTLDIRDPQTVQDIENGLIWDDSISFTNNYIDEKGLGHGPVLFHVALVNNPYITGMSGFQALSKAASHIRHAFSQKHTGSAIVLSKQVKELSSMKPIKNEKEFPVKVNYQDAEGKDVEATIEAGAELEVPEASAEGVKQQIDVAVAPAAEETDEEKAAREQKEQEDANVAAGKNPDGTEKTPEGGDDTTVTTPPAPADATTTPNPDSATNDGTPAPQLSKAEREELETLRTEKAETMFSKLLDEGKVVPAQKEAIISMAKTAGPEAVATMFSKAAKVIDFSEKGSQNNDKGSSQGDTSAQTDLSKNVKQWADLSQAERETNQKLGVSEQMYNETALANPAFYQKPVAS
jgi:phage I-like protein